MALGAALALHGGELRADFQRYYGLNLDDIGERYSYLHAAALCAHLPDDSALYRAAGDGWSRTQRMLAQMGRSLDIVWWQRTPSGQQKGAKPPDLYESPRALEIARAESARYDRAYMDEVAEALGIPENRR